MWRLVLALRPSIAKRIAPEISEICPVSDSNDFERVPWTVNRLFSTVSIDWRIYRIKLFCLASWHFYNFFGFKFSLIRHLRPIHRCSLTMGNTPQSHPPWAHFSNRHSGCRSLGLFLFGPHSSDLNALSEDSNIIAHRLHPEPFLELLLLGTHCR